jgi:hypothetical protein
MLVRLARLGYACKAFIYAVVGLLAATAAFNLGGKITDTRGALKVILSHPFGNTVLYVLGAGLCGYAAWRLLDAWFDPDRRGTSVKGLVIRVGGVLRGVFYGALGVEALRLANGLRGSDASDARLRSWTARALNVPQGEWLVGLIGLITAVYGVSEIVDAIKNDDGGKRDLSELPTGRRILLDRIARFGVAARAVLIVVVGTFLVRAAIQHDPREAQGIRGSILELVDAAGGRLALAAIALGLIAYAVDQALNARYRRIRSPVQ